MQDKEAQYQKGQLAHRCVVLHIAVHIVLCAINIAATGAKRSTRAVAQFLIEVFENGLSGLQLQKN